MGFQISDSYIEWPKDEYISTMARINPGLLCNLDCGFCYYRNYPQKNIKPILSVKDELDIAKDCGITHVEFSGGEPLYNPYLFNEIDYASQIGLHSSIQTNGTLLNTSTISLLKKSNVSELRISIHTSSSAIINILDMLTDFYVKVNITINRENYLDLYTLVNILISKNVKEINFLGLNKFSHISDSSFREYYIPYFKYKDILNRCLYLISSNGINYHIRFVPICMVDFSFRPYVIGWLQLLYDKTDWNPAFTENILVKRNLIIDGKKISLTRLNLFTIRKSECLKCKYLLICNGVELDTEVVYPEYSPLIKNPLER